MQLVAQGQVVAIEPRANGWAAVHIAQPGKQYPLKLSTKRAELIQLAQQLGWQVVDALYNEEQSTNINPHNNQPYVNRYLENLAPAGTMPQPQAQPQQPMAVPTTGLQPMGGMNPLAVAQTQAAMQPQSPQVPQGSPQAFGNLTPQPPQQAVIRHEVGTDEEREGRIMRQAATKVAAAFLPMLAEEDRNLGSLIRISEQLLKYYREGVSWETYPPQVPAQAPDPAEFPSQGYPANPGHRDPEGGDPGREQGDPGPGQFPEGY